MNIAPINPYLYFSANLNSPKLKFERQDFYVNMKGYGKNFRWADCVIKTADSSAKLIKDGFSFENILHNITSGVIKANKKINDLAKRLHTGILRTPRKGWDSDSDWAKYDLETPYGKFGLPKYLPYENRLDYVQSHPLDNPIDGIDLTRPVFGENKKYLKHGDSEYVNNALEYVMKRYKDFSKYLNKDLDKKDMKIINNDIAEMRWVLAHATPWDRGSDSISNVLIRSMYKAVGIKSYPLKEGVSLDLEAYCNNLQDYKKNFVGYFEAPPEIIN